jgi:hypothetical protein
MENKTNQKYFRDYINDTLSLIKKSQIDVNEVEIKRNIKENFEIYNIVLDLNYQIIVIFFIFN